MSVLIGIIGNDAARFHAFTASAIRLDRNPGDIVEFLIGGDWCGARNELASMCLQGQYSHLWFMDDDHVFASDIVTRLARHDLPVVTPICLTRQPPFPPVHYSERNPDNDLQYLPVPQGDGAATDGLVEIQAGGCAGMLIRSDVLKAVRNRYGNWFEYGDRSEDILFCERAKELGFSLWCDLSVRLGHITTATVWPAVDGDRWVTGLTIGKDLNLKIDPAEILAKERR